MASTDASLLAAQFASQPKLLAQILSLQRDLTSLELDRAKLSQFLAKRVQSLVIADGVAVALLRGDGRLYVEAGEGTAAPLVGRRAEIADYELSPRADACHRNVAVAPFILRRQCEEIGAASVLSVPLRFCGDIFGLLTAFANGADAFADPEANILLLVADSVAPSLFRLCELTQERARLHKTEEALKESEKMAMIGRESATIAHEIKNPLEALGNILYLLENKETLDESSRHSVEEAQDQLQQARDVSHRTLGFSRESTAPVPVNLTEILEAILRLYAGKIAYKRVQVGCRFDFAGEIQSFPGELRQVFSNLIVNALEAVERGRGRLMLHSRKATNRSSLEPGVTIVIADNGPGIKPEHRSTIFQPFFTTKEGKGTGLGLWVSGEIVRKHGGNIRFRSRSAAPGSGTAFSVFLPMKPKPLSVA